MRKGIQTGLIAGAALGVVVASATSAPALEVSQVYLAYKASEKTSCPRAITMKARALTDGPGTVKFIIRMAGGGKSGELSAPSVKGPDGKYSATYTQMFSIARNTETKYMAEVVGKGKISPWIDFKEECGPQVRDKKSTTTTSAPPPRAKHISEIDKDPKPSGEGKPIPSGGGKPIPSSGKPIAACKPMLSATRKLAVTRAVGIATAQAAWQSSALALYGASYARWSKAKDQSTSCDRKGLTFDCTVKARPCD